MTYDRPTNASRGRDNRDDAIILTATYAALINDSTRRTRPTWRQAGIVTGATALDMINKGDPDRLSFERME